MLTMSCKTTANNYWHKLYRQLNPSSVTTPQGMSDSIIDLLGVHIHKTCGRSLHEGHVIYYLGLPGNRPTFMANGN